MRKVSGWQRHSWRFLYKTKLEPRHWHVLEQDRTLMDGLKPGQEKFETLYAHDAGLVRLRRLLARTTRDQLMQLREPASDRLIQGNPDIVAPGSGAHRQHDGELNSTAKEMKSWTA